MYIDMVILVVWRAPGDSEYVYVCVIRREIEKDVGVWVSAYIYVFTAGVG